MKIGDKVFSQTFNEDVIVLDINGNVVDVYGSDGFNEVPKSDLLEYDAPNVNTPKPPTPKPTCKPKYETINCGATPTPTHRLSESNFCAPIKNNVKKESVLNMNVSKLFGEFGKVKNGEVALTFGGQIAIRRSADEYVAYDVAKEQIVNQMSLVITQASDMIFILPVTAIEVGDVIKVKGNFFQVLSINNNNSIHGINLNKGTKSTICKETNLFGINFYYKVQSLFSGALGAPVEPTFDAEGKPVLVATPPAINPMMLMMLSKDGSSDFGDMLPLLMMSGGLGGAPGGLGAMNPMMLMMLMGDKDGGSSPFGGSGGGMKDMLPLLLMSGGLGATPGVAGAPAIDPLMLMMLMK